MIGCIVRAEGRPFSRIGERAGASDTVGWPENGRDFRLQRGKEPAGKLKR